MPEHEVPIDPALIGELQTYSRRVVAKRNMSFFNFKPRNGESYDSAFFKAVIAPDLLTNLLNSFALNLQVIDLACDFGFATSGASGGGHYRKGYTRQSGNSGGFAL